MGENGSGEKQLVIIEGDLTEIERTGLTGEQVMEQLYAVLGLEAVVRKVPEEYDKEYSKYLSPVEKTLDKIIGHDPQASIRIAAKLGAFETYKVLRGMYDKKVGNLSSQITILGEKLDESEADYHTLAERLAGFAERITGRVEEDYSDLKTDRKALEERVTGITERVTGIIEGEYDKLKTDYETLNKEADHLRAQIDTLNKEKTQLTKRYESQITERDSKMKGLESEKTTLASELEQLRADYTQLKTTLTSELEQLRADYNQLKTTLTSELEQLRGDYNRLKAAITIAKAIPYEEIGEKLREGLYTFLLKDSKVPGMVIDGVGKFIDFKKYLGIAAERGAKEAHKHTEEILRKELGTTQ